MPRNKVKLESWLLMPDLHAPYHDQGAFATFLRVLSGRHWDGIVCLGDFGDFYKVSSFALDPRRKLSFKDEIDGCRKARALVDKAAKASGCKRKRFVQGNHEVRLDSYLVKRAPEIVELMDEEGLDWQGLLQLDRAGWEVTGYKQSIKLGKLRVSHDFGRAGVYAARQTQLDMGCSVAFGHTHRLQAHYQGTIDGPRHVSVTCGWLGDPAFIDYRHRDAVARDSVHGFAHVCLRPDGQFALTPVPIVDSSWCIVDGVLYSTS